MIVRIGLDVVEVARIKRAMQNPRFLPRILTAAERGQASSPARVAGRWAAKEAIAKCVGTHLGWHDVEVVNDAEGAPVARFNNFELPRGHRIHLTISHERGVAAAVAILEAV
jgi:holo-[acyl-carrier protein] synthase